MSITLRKMEPADLALGMRLKTQAGWNQTEDDWRRFLRLQAEGCFVAEWDGQGVATTTTCVFGDVGWIAMVLVDESFRHRGIGTCLVRRAVEYLEDCGVATVRLDATALGRPVYERMGFAAEHELARLEGVAGGGPVAGTIRSALAEDLDALATLDRQASGANRRRFLESLLADRPRGAAVFAQQGRLAGYAMLRSGSRATQIGPVIADSQEAGLALCQWGMAQCVGQAVFIDVPRQNRPAISWAMRQGLCEQRRLTRMSRGKAAGEQIDLLWASSGPEKG